MASERAMVGMDFCGVRSGNDNKVLKRWLEVSARQVESLIACEVM